MRLQGIHVNDRANPSSEQLSLFLPPPPRLPARTRSPRRPLLLARTAGTRRQDPASCLRIDQQRPAHSEQGTPTLRLGEFHFVHSFTSVPVQERLALNMLENCACVRLNSSATAVVCESGR